MSHNLKFIIVHWTVPRSSNVVPKAVGAMGRPEAVQTSLRTMVTWTVFTGGLGWTALVCNMPKSLAFVTPSWSGDDRDQRALKTPYEKKTGYLASSQGELNCIRTGAVFVAPTMCRSDNILRSPIQSVDDLFQRESRLHIPNEGLFPKEGGRNTQFIFCHFKIHRED